MSTKLYKNVDTFLIICGQYVVYSRNRFVHEFLRITTIGCADYLRKEFLELKKARALRNLNLKTQALTDIS